MYHQLLLLLVTATNAITYEDRISSLFEGLILFSKQPFFEVPSTDSGQRYCHFGRSGEKLWGHDQYIESCRDSEAHLLMIYGNSLCGIPIHRTVYGAKHGLFHLNTPCKVVEAISEFRPMTQSDVDMWVCGHYLGDMEQNAPDSYIPNCVEKGIDHSGLATEMDERPKMVAKWW